MGISKLVLLAICMIVVPLLSGCLGDSGSSSSGSGGSSSGGDSTYASGYGSTGGSTGSIGGSTVGSAVHNPEPATLALFGGGLIAYALSRRKKKK